MTTERDSVARHIKLEGGQDIALDFIVPDNPTIGGRVLGADRKPVPDALVWLIRPEYQRGVLKHIAIGPKTTGEDGVYTFDSALEVNRRYYVLAERPDGKDEEVPTYYPKATRIELATPVLLQTGEQRQVDIAIATAPLFCADGKIGKPSDFTVQEALLAGSNQVRKRGRTDNDGKYRVCGLPAGAYRLSVDEAFREFTIADADVHRADLAVAPAYLQLQVEWGTRPVPALTEHTKSALRRLFGAQASDDDLQNFALKLIERGLTGLEMQNGINELIRLLPGSDVTALIDLLQGSRFTAAVTLSGIANGLSTSLSTAVPAEAAPFPNGIPAGDYAVSVRAAGTGPEFGLVYTREIAYDGLKLADGVIRVAPGADGTVRVVVSSGACTLTVAVNDADDKPVADANVIVVPDSVSSVSALSRLAIHGESDDHGKYTVHALAPGKYRVLASMQSIRWAVPEDLEKLLPLMYQAGSVDLDGKSDGQIAVTPAVIQ